MPIPSHSLVPSAPIAPMQHKYINRILGTDNESDKQLSDFAYGKWYRHHVLGWYWHHIPGQLWLMPRN
jgi:hypothetical protein